MNITVILLGIVLVILVYILYTYFSNNTSTLSRNADLSTQTLINNIVSPRNTLYSYSIWVFVNSWKGNNHTIFSRAGNISLYLDPKQPILFCDISATMVNATTASQQKTIVTNNFPLQKWTYITVSVDNQFVDFYLNGKLVKSIKINGFPSIPPDTTVPISLGGSGFDAQASKFQRDLTPLDPQTVWTRYLSGNGNTSYFSSYNMNFSVLKNNVEQSKFSVF